MDKLKVWLPVFVGLMTSSVFAAGEQPFKITNTLRVGYDDNVYHRDSDEAEDSTFVSDNIDFSYHAAFSDRTDLMLKSRLLVHADRFDESVFPQLFATLGHSVSPRFLLTLNEHFQSGERTGGEVGGNIPDKDDKYWYFENTAGVVADYLLNEKNRMSLSADYDILRNKDDDTTFTNDYSTVSGGMAWKHEISPQRTFSTVNLVQRYTDYDNRDASFDATDAYLGFGHTFNPQWKCTLDVGSTYVSPDVQGAANDSSLNPLVNAGLIYEPSPMTRLSANAGYRYSESSDSRFGGQNSLTYSLGAKHDLTAKLTATATASFATVEYDEDAAKPAVAAIEEDRMDLGLRLSYKLNRMHSLEAGVRHSEKDRDQGEDWEQNVVDLGWRVELN